MFFDVRSGVESSRFPRFAIGQHHLSLRMRASQTHVTSIQAHPTLLHGRKIWGWEMELAGGR